MADWRETALPKGRQTLTIEDASGREVAIAYGEMGEGHPLFLLHGIGSWSYSWRLLVKPLAQHFRVICPDAKGYGFSEPSPGPEIPGHQVVELQRVIRALSDRPVTIAAESLGALTALAVAQSYPELIDRLILINVPIFPQRLPSPGMQWLSHLPLDAVRLFDQLQLARAFAPLIRETTRFLRQEVVVYSSCITDEDIHGLTYPFIYLPGRITQFATDLRQAAHEIQQLLDGKPNLISPIQNNLAKITCPTLILWADQDRWFPIQDGETLNARLPNSQFQILSNCGHNASVSNPEALIEAILSFSQPSSVKVRPS